MPPLTLPRRDPHPPKDCVVCGCQLNHYWRMCPWCESWQQAAEGKPPPQLTERQKTKVLERQLLESMPDLHEALWDSLTLFEQTLWARRWMPDFSRRIQFRAVAVCPTCRRELHGTAACPECWPGQKPSTLGEIVEGL